MRQLLIEFRRGAVADRSILYGVGVIWLAFLALLASRGINGLLVASYLENLTVYLSALLFFLVFLGGRELFRHRPERPIPFLFEFCARQDGLGHFMRGAPMLLALIVFMTAFSTMKSAIPQFHPFTWDHVWIAADRSIHGTDPWRLMQPVLGYPIVTAVLALLYHLWILLIYAGCVYFCFFVPDHELRARYFIGFFGIWTMIGVVLATALASVGPCFVGPLLGNHHYDAQMAYLHAANAHVPIMVLPVQQELLAWYLANSHGLGRGITAMPSMHVALAFLFFLAMRKVSRRAGIAAFLFCVVILVSSVHLAYHYAVDGYVSIAVTALIWWAAGALVRRSAGSGRPPGARKQEAPLAQPALDM